MKGNWSLLLGRRLKQIAQFDSRGIRVDKKALKKLCQQQEGGKAEDDQSTSSDDSGNEVPEKQEKVLEEILKLSTKADTLSLQEKS